jgi:hypothetical protein
MHGRTKKTQIDRRACKRAVARAKLLQRESESKDGRVKLEREKGKWQTEGSMSQDRREKSKEN